MDKSGVDRATFAMLWPVRIPDIAAAQRQLFTRAEADDKSGVDWGLESGQLTALAPGVLIATAALAALTGKDLYETRLLAELLHRGDEWHANRRSAAVVHGLPLLGCPPTAPLLVRERRNATERSSSRFRHLSALPPCERDCVNGIRVTSLPRTVFDISRREAFRSAVIVADAALRSGVPREDLQACADRHPRWPGLRAARDVIAFADGRAESPLESLGRVGCRSQGLPVFEPQVEVWVGRRMIARVDGLWRDQLLVFEGDGAVKFKGGADLRLLGRQEDLRATGLDVLRADWDELHSRQDDFGQRVRARFRERTQATLAAGVRLVSTTVRPTPLSAEDTYRWAA
ncbi:MAG: Uncharacterized protein JWO12_1717 [Frankiales bacterium]|nr:Uncharacterized protein [Frankiales bacterium]